jgi:four helix bundle protein
VTSAQIEINSFRDLKAWQAATEIAEKAYALTRRLPRSETYGITNKSVTHASVSVPANDR